MTKLENRWDKNDGCSSDRIPLEAFSHRLFCGLIADVTVRKFGKHGVRFTSKQRRRFLDWMLNGMQGEPPVPRKGLSMKAEVMDGVTPRDERKIQGRWKRLMAEAMDFKVRRLARLAFRQLKEQWPDAARRDARSMRGFERRLARTWRLPLELLEMQLYLARSLGAEVNDELRRTSTRNNGPLIEVLTSLQARACLIAAEVLTLLRGGYAEGAMARWRSLHEVVVVQLFIHRHGSKTARRYLDHEAVESWKAAESHDKHCQALGVEPIEAGKRAQLDRQYHGVLKRYGAFFKSDYGWAAPDLSSKATIAAIEEAVGLEAWRPFYRRASHPVHANPKGVKDRLVLMVDSQPVLPAGPSNYGLADPGHYTGLSLAKATAVLLQRSTPSDERTVLLRLMQELSISCAFAFANAQRRIEDREMKLRGSKPRSGHGS
jgi:hypothetical protein